ncbi:MAG TPA: endonuclease/exonuclease/phosphatase family protein, partial [Cellvibrionaceae bacterium]
LATFLPILRIQAWPIRMLDFPRLQVSICWCLLLLAIMVYLPLSLLSIVLMACALSGLIYKCWWILPYTALYKKEVQAIAAADPGNTLSIITANVLTPNRRAPELLTIIRQHQPDIVLTLESDQWWQTQLDVLENDYPYTVKCPLDNLYGMHVYSRLPLIDTQVDYLVEDDKPSIHTAVLLPSGRSVRCHFLHPAPPSPTENDESSERDAELLVVAHSVADAKQPTIVAGDLNDVAWSRTTRSFRAISGLLDPRVGRGMFNTFHAHHWFLRWPLDHLFHSSHFFLAAMQRLDDFGSDHFPLLTTLVLKPSDQHQQDGIEPSEEQKQFAREKVNEEPVSKGDVPEPGE